jgi:acyl-CoA synthetase (AMP-forming)/AMP-acid ligase II
MAAFGYARPQVSYAEFVSRFQRLAGGRAGASGSSGSSGPLGLGRGDRVVLCMENRPEFLDLLFGCWSAGLCAVPVNAKLHPREVAHIVADSQARLVVASASLAPGIRDALDEISSPPAGRPRVIVAGAAEYAALYASDRLEPVPCAPSDLAWIFYTSGTTGRPKGAMLSHRNLIFMAMGYLADIEPVSPGDAKLHAAPLSHGSGLYALPHLLGGGTQVILDGFDAVEVLQAFEELRAATMFAAPTMVTRLVSQVQSGWPKRAGAADAADAPASRQRFAGLRTLYYGGAPMYVSDLQRALECFGPRLYQLYGQGESPMTITGLAKRDHEGDGGPEHLARLASCGPARSGVLVRVVDEQGRDRPVGESGEVITRSDAVMSGYWNNPAATQAALRDGWLWTGDVGALDAKGYLSLRDRSKDLIISGGTNIYPREIEEVLLLHPQVLECSVVGAAHPDWGEEVVAFVVARDAKPPSIEALDDLCLQHIARFKRPRQYRFVPALPKNAYGKVLKTQLRQTIDADPASGSAQGVD